MEAPDDIIKAYVRASLEGKAGMEKLRGKALAFKGLEHTLLLLERVVTVAEQLSDPNATAASKNAERILRLAVEPKVLDYLFRHIWSLTPQQLLAYLAHFDERQEDSLRQACTYEDDFHIVLGKEEDKEPLYLLYDQPDDAGRREWDVFLQRTMPINGHPKVFHYDYHLGWHTLLKKYSQGKKIVLVTQKPENRPYIYVLTFLYFRKYFEGIEKGSNIIPIREDVLTDVRNNKAILILSDCHESSNHSKAFQWFYKQLENRGILKNTFVFSGDMANAGRFAQTGKPLLRWLKYGSIQPLEGLNFFCLRYFEEAVGAIKSSFYPEYSVSCRLKQLKENAAELRHFLCLNRVLKDFRAVLSYLFYKHGWKENAFISMDRFDSKDDFQFGHNANKQLLRMLEEPGARDFKASLPWKVDTDDLQTNHWNTINLSFLNQSFMWVVTETAFTRNRPAASSFLTEKTYKPLAFGMPFLMVGEPGTLATLKAEGYQTFSQWWNEDYDEEEDPLRRMNSITSVLDDINKWPKDRLTAVSHEMESVLQHNQDWLLCNRRAAAALEPLLQAYDSMYIYHQ